MVNSLESILEEISKAEVKLGRGTGRMAINLFEYQEVVDLHFNGHPSLKDYDHHCEALLQELKSNLDSIITANLPVHITVRDIDLLLYEVRSQEKRYFPSRAKEDWFLKTHFKIKHQKEQFSDDIVRGTILRYLNIQQRLIERTKQLLDHRFTHLRTSLSIRQTEIEPHQSETEQFATSVNGQIQMFPENQYRSKLQWNRSQCDLLELILCLKRSHSITSIEGTLKQKDLISEFSQFLNFQMKYPDQSIQSIKRRKKDQTSYTFELHGNYRNLLGEQ